jgi:hypothetical protein
VCVLDPRPCNRSHFQLNTSKESVKPLAFSPQGDEVKPKVDTFSAQHELHFRDNTGINVSR